MVVLVDEATEDLFACDPSFVEADEGMYRRGDGVGMALVQALVGTMAVVVRCGCGGCRCGEPDMRPYRTRMTSEPVAQNSRSSSLEVRPGDQSRDWYHPGDAAVFDHHGPVPQEGLVLVIDGHALGVLGG
jgi:hypothetical protein